MQMPFRDQKNKRVDELLRADASRLRAGWAGPAPRRAARPVLARLGPAVGVSGLAAAVVAAVLLGPASAPPPKPKPVKPGPAIVAEWSSWEAQLSAARAEAERRLDEAGRWPGRVTLLDRRLVELGDEAAAAATVELDALASDARRTVAAAAGPLAELHRAITRAQGGEVRG